MFGILAWKVDEIAVLKEIQFLSRAKNNWTSYSPQRYNLEANTPIPISGTILIKC